MLPDFFLAPPSHAIYPIQGKALSQDDVGKKVLRISPVMSKHGILDFSYMTIQTSAENISYSAFQVVNVTPNSVTLSQASRTFQIKKKYIDANC